MKRTLPLTVGFGLFASVALAQIPPAATSARSAQDFVNKVAISDMFEIQSSQLALSKEADPTPSRSRKRWFRIIRRHRAN